MWMYEYLANRNSNIFGQECCDLQIFDVITYNRMKSKMYLPKKHDNNNILDKHILYVEPVAFDRCRWIPSNKNTTHTHTE